MIDGPAIRPRAFESDAAFGLVAMGGAIGILLGILLGDYAHFIRPVGEVYVMLLEVAVYPT